MKWLLRLAVVLFAAVWLTSPATVLAADYYWNNPLSGSYHDTNNWSPSGYVPVDPGDVAIINNSGTAEISADIGDSILGVGTLHVGDTTGEGHVLQTAGNVYVDNFFYVGSGHSTPTDLPTYTMQGGSLTMNFTDYYWGFRIGEDSVATMSVTGSNPMNPTTVFVDDVAIIGYLSGSNGTLEMSGESTATFNQGLYLGRWGEEGNMCNGTVNLSGNATMTTTTGALGSYYYSHGEINISGNAKFTATGWFNVGEAVDCDGLITVKDNGILETYDIRVGVYAGGNGTVIVGGTAGTSKWDSHGGVVVGWLEGTGEIVANTNSLINMNSYLQVGVDGGTGNAVVNSGGTLNLNSWSKVGAGENSSGAVVVNSGGSMNVVGYLSVGTGSNSTGEVTLHDGGTIDVADNNGWVSFGEAGGGGTFTMDGGQCTVGTDTVISVGYYHNTHANWNQTGGTFTSGSPMDIGRYGGIGTVTFAGNAVASLPGIRVGVNWGDNETDLGVGEVVVGGNAQVAVTGVGTYTDDGTNEFSNTITIGMAGGDGTWTQNGGTTTCANDVVLAEYDFYAWDTAWSPGVGVVNLNGGTFACPGMMVRANSDVVTGTAGTVNLNGGTLKATGDSSDFFTVEDPGITPTATLTLKVQAGGAVIDTDTYNVTISNPLAEDAGSTGGGLTKLGGGTLTLTGSGHSYTGDTVVSAGMLSTTDAAMMNDDANLWIALGAVMDLDFTGTDTIGKLYLGGSAQATGTWGATGSGAAHVDDVHFSGLGMVLVTQSAFQIPGDADLDGVVDEDDAVRVAENWGVGSVSSPATWTMGNFNGDYKVDAADAAILAANWGATAGGGSEEAPVPEPSTLLLLMLGLMSMACFRRR